VQSTVEKKVSNLFLIFVVRFANWVHIRHTQVAVIMWISCFLSAVSCYPGQGSNPGCRDGNLAQKAHSYFKPAKGNSLHCQGEI